eukprot:2785110-Rhodomonas_salina.2
MAVCGPRKFKSTGRRRRKRTREFLHASRRGGSWSVGPASSACVCCVSWDCKVLFSAGRSWRWQFVWFVCRNASEGRRNSNAARAFPAAAIISAAGGQGQSHGE